MMEITRNLLLKMYNEDKKSMRKIASELQVGKTTIEYYLKKFKIKRRTHEEARKINPKKYGWTRGLTKDKDQRIARLAKSIKEAYRIKRRERIKEMEKEFSKPIKEIINELYWRDNLNQEQIAEKLRIDRKIIIELMKKFKISKRPKYQYISSLKGENHSLYGKTWEHLHGKEDAKKRKAIYSSRFRKLTIRRLENNEFPFFDTKIEKKIAKELLKKKIPFIKQFNMGNKFVCDFAIPIYKIIIECDGDYWHANPKIYDYKKLDLRQKNKIKRDKLKDKFITKKDWRILRFFESDINSNVSRCIDKIEKNIRQRIEQIKKVKSPIDVL